MLFWASLSALGWTHVGYPFFASCLARLRSKEVDQDLALVPTVVVIVAAHNEESVIERRVFNLRELDYPSERLQIVVMSDASTDRTEELAERAGARVFRNGRGGKVSAQNLAVRKTAGEIVAFSDANSTWAPDALRMLIRNFADPEVGYVCGQLRLLTPDGSNREGVYWRYEMITRAAESRLGSITGGNGSIYAVRRSDYVDVDPRFGHDLSLPYVMVQRGRRAIYEPDAHAFEKPTPTNETEYRRKVRMFEHCWLIVLKGRMLRRQPLGYAIELVSHRHLRYASGVLHLVLLAMSIILAGRSPVYAIALGLQAGGLAAAAFGVGIARYYVLVTLATVTALWNYLRRGVPAIWEAAEGTR
jgi:cellulose synthase/poly-beta-1,6-N-acetylglucosamine synthase-like glycosyltransferase